MSIKDRMGELPTRGLVAFLDGFIYGDPDAFVKITRLMGTAAALPLGVFLIAETLIGFNTVSQGLGVIALAIWAIFTIYWWMRIPRVRRAEAEDERSSFADS